MRYALPLALLLATPAFAADDAPPPISGTRLDLTATASVARVPDIARIGAGVVTQAATAGAAMRANAQRMGATIAALRQAGVAAADMQTSAITLAPHYLYADDRPPTLTGYEATNRVAVRLRAIDRVGPVLDALVAAGANQIDGPSFALDKPDAALDEARAQAIATVRARAELYARTAGLRVKRIVRISEESASASPIGPPMMMMARKADTTPVAAGDQTLSVTVAVTFELG